MLEKVTTFFYKFCQNVIGLFMLVIAGFVTVLNLFYTSSVTYVWTEDVSLSRTSWVPILLAVVLFVVLLFLQRWLVKWQEKYLFCFFAVCYLVVGVYWVFNACTVLRLDADSVHSAAMELLEGDFSFLMPGMYIWQNEHQLGIVTYEYLLGLISSSVRLQYFVNLLEIIGINFLSWRLADLCFAQNHRVNLLTILFSFLFLPQFFFLAFAYGIVPGLFCLMCSFYFQQRYFKDEKWRWFFLCLLMLVLAVAVKGNNIIGAIAIAILFVMRVLKNRMIKHLLPAVLALVCAGSIGTGLVAFYAWDSGIELCGGKPSILYIAMGTEPGNQQNAPGWYNGYNDWAFEEAGFDPEKAAEIAKNTLKDTIFTYQGHPDWMLSFFVRKLQSIWCDPMYESLWSGPLPDAGQESGTEFLNAMYSGKAAEPYIAVFMKGFLILMFVLAVLSALGRKNQKYDCDYSYLYFVGGFLLHILWEAKSQYVYPYVFVLLPCCAQEMAVLGERLETFLEKRCKASAKAQKDLVEKEIQTN